MWYHAELIDTMWPLWMAGGKCCPAGGNEEGEEVG